MKWERYDDGRPIPQDGGVVKQLASIDYFIRTRSWKNSTRSFFYVLQNAELIMAVRIKTLLIDKQK